MPLLRPVAASWVGAVTDARGEAQTVASSPVYLFLPPSTWDSDWVSPANSRI